MTESECSLFPPEYVKPCLAYNPTNVVGCENQGAITCCTVTPSFRSTVTRLNLLIDRLLGTSASDHIASASSSTLTLMMVVLGQVSTRGASNTLRLACETLEVREGVPLTAPLQPLPPRTALTAPYRPYRPLPPRIAPYHSLTAPYCPLPPLTAPHPGARPNSARAALRHRAALRRGQ